MSEPPKKSALWGILGFLALMAISYMLYDYFSRSQNKCDSIFEQHNFHLVQLGPYCGSKFAGGDFVYNDFYVECGDINGFYIPDGRFTCRSYVYVPAGSDATVPLSGVRMYTDHRWADSMREECYEFEPAAEITANTTGQHNNTRV